MQGRLVCVNALILQLCRQGSMILTSAFGVRRGKAGLFQLVIPPGNLLRPEESRATVDVTQWLKPPVRHVTKFGDSASLHAVI